MARALFACLLSLFLGAAIADQSAIRIDSAVSLRTALSSGAYRATLVIHGEILLSEPLSLDERHAGWSLIAAGADSSLFLPFSPTALTGPVINISNAANVSLQGLCIAFVPSGSAQDASNAAARSALPRSAAAITAVNASHMLLTRLRVDGGVRIVGGPHSILSWSEVSNSFGANGGTCVNLASCGNASTLIPCNSTIHDNDIHDCRQVHSPYDPSAQGVLLGGPDGTDQCTVGVVIRNNNVSRTDQMGIRVENDNYSPCVGNQVILNKITDWGQLPQSEGGDNRDCGCMYLYGHWYAPGNNFTFNFCHATNDTWGQNGVYLDDAASGATVVGNVFLGATQGSALKVNGGAFHTIDSNLVVGGIGFGFANCRALRGASAADYYTCEGATGRRWLAILEANNYLQPPWSQRFPWYAGWCSNTTQGPNATACAPAGAPPGYECAVMSRGNAVSNLAGVQMARNGSFTLQTAPGFPAGTGACPEFVRDGDFNSIAWGQQRFYGADQFVDAAAGDYTLRADSQVYADLPSFVRVPFRQIGVGGSGRA